MSDENILNQQQNPDIAGGGMLDAISKLISHSGTDLPHTEKGSGDPSLVSSLLSNPEILSKLPEIMSVISPLIGNLTSISSAKGSAAPVSVAPSESYSPTRQISSELHNHIELLCALKPYLKKERREAIDYMIKLSRLGDVLKTL